MASAATAPARLAIAEPPRGLRAAPLCWSDLTRALRIHLGEGDGGGLDARLAAGTRGVLEDGSAAFHGQRVGTYRLNGRLRMISADHATPFLAGTLVRTPGGLRRVESLRAGDLVSTLDNGAQRVLWTGRRRVAGDGRFAPIEIRPGTLGNAVPVRLAASQHLVLKDASIAMLFGRDEAVVSLRHLLDGSRVRRAPCRLAEHVLLATEGYQVLDQGDFGLECAEPPLLAEAAETILEDAGLCRHPQHVEARLRVARGGRPGLTGFEGRLLGAMIAANAPSAEPRRPEALAAAPR
ncbi:Hint domain-containing protein [Oceanicola sp. S124]|uniref:Hint domain-containing protein n=1 Tax=Oceanicola sp. S124 TaxID=1042378 RepID=UPI0002559374|nr:Hint domain-containing protein [Oceanicola sp. S124]